MKRGTAFTVGSLIVLSLLGCKGAPDEEAPAPTAAVEVEPAARDSIEETLIAYGSVDFAPAHTRALTVQVESQVAERFVLAGSHVKSGQPLVRLVPSAASRLDVDKASRDAALADADAQRQARLRAQGLATELDLRTAKAAAETAAQLRSSLDTRIGAQGLTLRAPIDGVVDALTLQPGDVVAPGTLILRIVDPAALLVRVGLEPEDALRVKSGQAVGLSPFSSSASSIEGRVSEVDARVDATSRLAGATVQPTAGAPLVPGSTVRARIVLSTHSNVVTVQRPAVLYENDKPFVFVAVQGKAQKRAVSTGLADDRRIEITQGIRPGEAVVTVGNYELEDGMAIELPDDKK